jgi:hypothetical protein
MSLERVQHRTPTGREGERERERNIRVVSFLLFLTLSYSLSIPSPSLLFSSLARGPTSRDPNPITPDDGS